MFKIWSRKSWLQSKLESQLNKPLFSKEEKINLLSELTAADGLERYLGAKFPGAKRFSLEGSDAFIPLMKVNYSSCEQTRRTRCDVWYGTPWAV